MKINISEESKYSRFITHKNYTVNIIKIYAIIKKFNTRNIAIIKKIVCLEKFNASRFKDDGLFVPLETFQQ